MKRCHRKVAPFLLSSLCVIASSCLLANALHSTESMTRSVHANVNNKFPKKFHSVEAPTANTLLR